MKNTKIICTIGPSSRNVNTLQQMVQAGMNVARINFSHGTDEEHQQTIDMLKQLRTDMQIPLAIMLDTKGPELRIGNFENGKISLREGDEFVFTTKQVLGNEKMVSVSYQNLHNDVVAGNTLLLNDGLLTFTVTKVEGQNIHTICNTDGVLSNHKGMHVPNVLLNMPFLSEADKHDLQFAVTNDLDFIAASFVSNADNVVEMKTYLESLGSTDIRIIAKIENQNGVDNIDQILKVADGIMVARGDMGVEIDFCHLPKIQKDLIKKANLVGKEVIVATEMLESMILNARPTRAEISDVANAVYDEASAVMLSGETASGKNPVKAVKTMADICSYVESTMNYYRRFLNRELNEKSITDTISHSACHSAFQLKAKAVVVSTESGKTARVVSKFRPNMPVMAFVLNPKTYYQLSLVWGVVPLFDPQVDTVEELVTIAKQEAKQRLHVRHNDIIVITAGIPLGEKGNTNLLQIEQI